jgi:hypothetical protein
VHSAAHGRASRERFGRENEQRRGAETPEAESCGKYGQKSGGLCEQFPIGSMRFLVRGESTVELAQVPDEKAKEPSHDIGKDGAPTV